MKMVWHSLHLKISLCKLRHMGTIASIYVRLLYEHLKALGVNPETLFSKPWPSAGDLGFARTSFQEWKAMLDIGAATTGEAAFGVAVAKRYGWQHLGLLGYLVRSSSNVIEALGRVERFHGLASDYNPVKVEVSRREVKLSWPLRDGVGGQLWDEFGIAAGFRCARMITGAPLDDLRVEFCGATPADIEPYSEFFGPNVYFECSVPAVTAPIELLATPLPRHDEALTDLLEREAIALLKRLRPQAEQIQAMRERLLQLLPLHRANLASLAQSMNCTERTLQRYLSLNNLSFSELLTELRKEIACEHLESGQYSLSDVASLLGYADQSVFTRAFKQWFGVSPRRWRLELPPSSKRGRGG
nr:AraC family transcriptional regulator ligand-binding domain-containing protein [Oceanococcus sp. HetDA_MAG_MS8]